MKSAAIVLLSSGLDSTVNLFAAQGSYTVRLALTFHYGQKAAAKEIERSTLLAAHLRIEHRVLELPFFKTFRGSSLINDAIEIPAGHSVQIDHLEQSKITAAKVWVPNRNGVLLNIAAAVAEDAGASVIIPGFNIEEAQTFPDNSEGFLQALTQGFSFSTGNHVQAQCLTTQLNKTEIFALGQKLNVPFELVWPCYFSGSKPCGQCESCLRFTRAAHANGAKVEDLWK